MNTAHVSYFINRNHLRLRWTVYTQLLTRTGRHLIQNQATTHGCIQHLATISKHKATGLNFSDPVL